MQNSAGATSVPAIAAAAAAAAAGACWAVKRALGRPKVAKSGAWSSKISSELIVSKSVRLASASFGKDGALYWLEARPQEGGRRVLVRRLKNGRVQDVTPGPESGMNVRTRIHEYGGGDYVVSDQFCFFVNFTDQQIYSQRLDGDTATDPKAITSGDSNTRYADLAVDSKRNKIFAICESHSEGGGEPKNELVSIDLLTGTITVIFNDADFCSSPRVSPDCQHICWLSWTHPDMPWDATALWTGEIDGTGAVIERKKVAGGPKESVVQPEWRDDGALVFLSDRSGFWNLYSYLPSSRETKALCPQAAEFGGPSWMLGWRHYCLLPGGHVLASVSHPEAPGAKLLLIAPDAEVSHEIQNPYTDFGFSLSAQEVDGKITIACIGGSYTKMPEVAMLKVASVEKIKGVTAKSWTSIKKSTELSLPPSCISVPEKIVFPTAGGDVAYMFFYPPQNPKFALRKDEKPALLVNIHGGPTGFAAKTLVLERQYWTSRGFAVADIDYRGSAGYGREFRDKLKGAWGVADVEDCMHAAKHLADDGLVDSEKMCINGGSAGGFTTLSALLGDSPFKAGACRYGVADMELLAKETHKFESRYLDGLVGPYPEAKSVYQMRSPLNHTERLNRAVIFYHGDEDKVVPPNQAQTMYDALKSIGVPTAYILYKGEGHGFRQDSNIRNTLDSELYFYGQVLSFHPLLPKDFKPIDIDNLDGNSAK